MHPVRIIFLLFILFTTACSLKTNRFKQGKRTGLWIFRDSTHTSPYLYKGKFKKGQEIGTWKYFWNDTLMKREKYRGNIANVKTYYSNGKLRSCGKTQLVINKTETHWFNFGDWYYYDELGKFQGTRTYDQGQLINEQWK